MNWINAQSTKILVTPPKMKKVEIDLMILTMQTFSWEICGKIEGLETRMQIGLRSWNRQFPDVYYPLQRKTGRWRQLRLWTFLWRKETGVHRDLIDWPISCGSGPTPYMQMWLQLRGYLETYREVSWVVLGEKTEPTPKYGQFSSENQRPVTCLNNMYKWFTSCLLKPMDQHLDDHELMQGQQRGAKTGCSGTMVTC